MLVGDTDLPKDEIAILLNPKFEDITIVIFITNIISQTDKIYSGLVKLAKYIKNSRVLIVINI